MFETDRSVPFHFRHMAWSPSLMLCSKKMAELSRGEFSSDGLASESFGLNPFLKPFVGVISLAGCTIYSHVLCFIPIRD